MGYFLLQPNWRKRIDKEGRHWENIIEKVSGRTCEVQLN